MKKNISLLQNSIIIYQKKQFRFQKNSLPLHRKNEAYRHLSLTTI